MTRVLLKVGCSGTMSGPPGPGRVPGGHGARVGDAAAEVQDLVKCLGVFSGASGVYLVRPPVTARMSGTGT